VVAAVGAAEYVARHVLLFWLPVLGALPVNAMLPAGLVYLVLAGLTGPPRRRLSSTG
jgi:hypothetical protein